MNYIFLDIDGVLNNKDYILLHKEKLASIDESKLKLLSDFCNKYNCNVILSSSWRSTLNDNLLPLKDFITLFNGDKTLSRGKYMIDLFKTYNLPLLGKTTNYKTFRGDQILDYVENNFSDNDHFVILDDEDDKISYYFGDRFIKTDFYGEGLTENHLNLIKSKLNLKEN